MELGTKVLYKPTESERKQLEEAQIPFKERYEGILVEATKPGRFNVDLVLNKQGYSMRILHTNEGVGGGEFTVPVVKKKAPAKKKPAAKKTTPKKKATPKKATAKAKAPAKKKPTTKKSTPKKK